MNRDFDHDFSGRTVLITGVARGMGRSHALAFAKRGATIIGVDSLEGSAGGAYELATEADAAKTARLVEQHGGRIVMCRADVRRQDEIDAAVRSSIDTFGGVDVVVANAGVVGYGQSWEIPEEDWANVIDVDLSGVWRTCKSVIPYLIETDRSGSIVVVSSTAGVQAGPGMAHYAAAKHGVIGLVRSLAVELAPHSIRVNAVAPTTVRTPMVDNPSTLRAFGVTDPRAGLESIAEELSRYTLLPTPWIESRDVTEAAVFLASHRARYITGSVLPVDAGYLAKP